VTQDLVVIEDDCGTSNGVAMKALVEGGEVVEALRDRILGRVAVADVVNPETQETLYEAGTPRTNGGRNRTPRHRRSARAHAADLRNRATVCAPATAATSAAARWSTSAKPSA
jgi:hypothetical protein